MEKVFRGSTAGQALFHLALVFSFLLLGTTSTWAAVVTTLADSGPGSLRQAILDANTDAVATAITFDPKIFRRGNSGTILLSTALPTLSGLGDSIDGTGAGVVLDGSAIPQDCTVSANCVGLRVRQSNVTIRNLIIQKFPFDAIRVEPANVTPVTGVVIDGNTLIGNGRRGIRIAGGSGPGNTLGATVTNNAVTDSGEAGILVLGNVNETGDPAGNTVTVTIDNNIVKNTNKVPANSGGDGITIIGGVGDGDNNVVTATVSNNDVKNIRDDGIVATGCGSLFNASGTSNTVDVTIIKNSVKDNGGVGIGASGTAAGTTCSFNTVRFEISDNTVSGNASNNINVTGGPGQGHDLQGIISNNSVKNSPSGDGIAVSGGSGTGNVLHDIAVSGNQVSGNLNRGILINGGSNSVNAVLDVIDILSNIVHTNGDQGILITGGTLSENAILSDILVDGNTSDRNGTRGIIVTRGTTLSALPPLISLAGVTNNTAKANADDGIFISNNIPGAGGATPTPVSGNLADRNGVDGIDINSTGYSLSNNTASKNTVDGINAVGNVNGGGNTGKNNASCNTPGCF